MREKKMIACLTLTKGNSKPKLYGLQQVMKREKRKTACQLTRLKNLHKLLCKQVRKGELKKKKTQDGETTQKKET